MRQLSWNIFANTGNIEAYLLYKESQLLNAYAQKQVARNVAQDGRDRPSQQGLR